ncbi:MAG TPA: hypothetical protein VK469_16090 [Candidatus Kapabacteria bacterium]|nr:hypothetical protein [Candidatus Kapabacteria bacterium]
MGKKRSKIVLLKIEGELQVLNYQYSEKVPVKKFTDPGYRQSIYKQPISQSLMAYQCRRDKTIIKGKEYGRIYD